MGVVYLARDVRLGRLAALKTLAARYEELDPEDDDAMVRFRREAQLAGSLSHPNIVTLYEVGYEKNRFTYLAMEYIEGESLLSMMKRLGRLPLDVTCRVIDDVLQALAYAHERGIIHRDIKPGNILLSTSGATKITDFGVARMVQSSGTDITERGQLLGTPHYMSPEQIAGREIDVRSDLFSVGVVMFEMLAMRKPFEGAALTDVLYNVVHGATPDLIRIAPGTPQWCAAFVARLLAKNAAERFPSAAAASKELRRLMSLNGIDREADESPLALSFAALTQDETPTTPITAPNLASPTMARRIMALPVPHLVGIMTVMLLVAITAASIFVLLRYVNGAPETQITTAQIEELQSKKQALAQADLLYEVGAYEESRRRYAEHLERYPESQVARDGIAKTDAALAEQARRAGNEDRARTTSPRTRTSDRNEMKVAKVAEQPQKKSAWERIKGWFRR
jgi:serine/threonine protein kinase